MNCLLNTPGLPDTKVTSVLVSAECPAVITALNQLGIETFTVAPNSMLEESIGSHPDCVYFQLNSEQIFIDKSLSDNIVNYLTIVRNLNDFSFTAIGESVRSPYPDDVKLNCKRISNKLICNSKYVSEELKETANDLGIELVHVNQGYSACSTIVLNDPALITDDESIHYAADKSGIDSLLISKGSVKLKNHKYGFIGGTCGMIDKNLLAFNGNINTHTDSDSMISFLNKYNVKYICLNDNELTDIGGIIPLTQNM